MRWTLLTVIVSALIGPTAAFAQAPLSAPEPAGEETSCITALDSLQAILRRDYPGYRYKLAGREAALAVLNDSVRAIARTSDHHSVCIPALWRWTGFFQDPHVMLWQAAPPPESRSNAAAPSTSTTPGEDPDRPSLDFVDDSTAVLRLPDFDLAYKVAIDSLIAANRARLLATPHLVVDVRGNGGGCTCSYESVIPLLYTGPIFRYGVEIWTSEANVAHLRSWLMMDSMPEGMKAQVRAVLPELEANPNQFVTFVEDGALRLDTVYPRPREVAVLVDGGCASSCENFVLDALQSEKVTVLGSENTKGVGDYGNVRSVWLPGWRRLRIPTTRSRRLLEEGPLDGIGLAPEVRIPEAESDAVEFARRYLHTAGSVLPNPALQATERPA